jgi:hypothetical protein
MSTKSHGGMTLTGENRRIRIKTTPSATLSTTNVIRAEPGANPRLPGERPMTNSPSLARLQSIGLAKLSLL